MRQQAKKYDTLANISNRFDCHCRKPTDSDASHGSGRSGELPSRVRNIVIVHGAWADGSSWSKVIPLLQAKGLHVVAVQNPLTSLADDVAATEPAIALKDGLVLLVGQSYGEWLSRRQETIQR
jgi:pimeloyl-ACP methyl ester carboxylesterase